MCSNLLVTPKAVIEITLLTQRTLRNSPADDDDVAAVKPSAQGNLTVRCDKPLT